MARPSVAEKAVSLLQEPERIARVVHPTIEAYRVLGSKDSLYFVIVDGGEILSCSCRAGQFGMMCYHATAVLTMLGGAE